MRMLLAQMTLCFWLMSPASAQSPMVKRLDELGLASLTHERRGKVLLVNVWATWCVPCVEEFPDLVRLERDTKGKGADVVLVNADDEDDLASKVLPFLRKMNVTFPTYQGKFEGNDRFINQFDSAWGGALPATFVYDVKGNHTATLFGKQSYKRFEEAIRQATANVR